MLQPLPWQLNYSTPAKHCTVNVSAFIIQRERASAVVLSLAQQHMPRSMEDHNVGVTATAARAGTLSAKHIPIKYQLS